MLIFVYPPIRRMLVEIGIEEMSVNLVLIKVLIFV